MINSSKLAEAVLWESTALSKRRSFNKMLVEAPLPPFHEMAQAIEIAFWASLLTEEGRLCRPRLLYIPSEKSDDRVHYLKEPLLLNPENLRKLTPAQGPLGFLTWEIVHGQLFITGIQARQANDPPNLIISAPNAGAIDITWHYFRIVTFRAGEIRQLSQCALPDASQLYALVSKALVSFEPHFLGAIVRKISKQDHGGALWIMSELNQAHDIHLNYQLKPDERTMLERFDKHEAREYWLSSIANLAAIDGAVLLDSRMRVRGYGAFIKTDKPTEVERLLPNGKQEIISSADLGGGRHRSAVEFCKSHAPAAAIVISVDGRITFMTSLNATTKPLCAEIATLGFSDTFT